MIRSDAKKKSAKAATSGGAAKKAGRAAPPAAKASASKASARKTKPAKAAARPKSSAKPRALSPGRYGLSLTEWNERLKKSQAAGHIDAAGREIVAHWLKEMRAKGVDVVPADWKPKAAPSARESKLAGKPPLQLRLDLDRLSEWVAKRRVAISASEAPTAARRKSPGTRSA